MSQWARFRRYFPNTSEGDLLCYCYLYHLDPNHVKQVIAEEMTREKNPQPQPDFTKQFEDLTAKLDGKRKANTIKLFSACVE